MIEPQSTQKNALHKNSIKIPTLYGTAVIAESVLIELLKSPSIQRLKYINQYGIAPYLAQMPPYSRYTHSIGVMVLLRHYGASLQEQIAGLLHDVSHTVFSHVGDFLYKNNYNDSYQDDIHEWYIAQTELKKILGKYGYAIQDILHKNDRFCLLEQPLPHLCADRLEYVLYGGFIKQLLSKSDITAILHHVIIVDNQWVFNDSERAEQFANCSLHLTEHVFANPVSLVTYRWAAQALQRACDIGLISKEEIHFSIDDIIWQKLCTANDNRLKKCMHTLLHSNTAMSIGDEKNYDLHITGKFRGIDPWVLHDNEMQKLTDISTTYKQEFTQVQKYIKQGHFVKLALKN